MSSGIPPGAGPSGQPRLLDRVRYAIRARHYSLRTEEAYVGWIRRYILFHNKRHPLEMAEPEIKRLRHSPGRRGPRQRIHTDPGPLGAHVPLPPRPQ